MSTENDTHAVELPKLGTVYVRPTSGDQIAVKFGASAGDPLTCNGVEYEGWAHLYRHADGEWYLKAEDEAYGRSLTLWRAGTVTDGTDAAMRSVGASLVEHVARWSRENAEALADAGRAARERARRDREAYADALDRIARYVRREAAALAEDGARMIRREARLSSGVTVRTAHVQRADGAIMPGTQGPRERVSTVSDDHRWSNDARDVRPAWAVVDGLALAAGDEALVVRHGLHYAADGEAPERYDVHEVADAIRRGETMEGN